MMGLVNTFIITVDICEMKWSILMVTLCSVKVPEIAKFAKNPKSAISKNKGNLLFVDGL